MNLDLKNKQVWDQWRDNYDTLTTNEQKEFYNKIEAEFPDQKHYNIEQFFSAVSVTLPRNVVEFGGWKGSLAKETLRLSNWIDSWVNIEICPEAIAKTVCKDERYSVVEPANFKWFSDPPFDPFNTDLVVATHFMEHISNYDFKTLIAAIRGAKYVYMEIPISWFGSRWKCFGGTHKLTMGWYQVNRVMRRNGYLVRWDRHKNCRLFKFGN